MKIICFLKTFWYTFIYGVDYTYISGHSFIGDDPWGELVCNKCGYVSKNEINKTFFDKFKLFLKK